VDFSSTVQEQKARELPDLMDFAAPELRTRRIFAARSPPLRQAGEQCIALRRHRTPADRGQLLGQTSTLWEYL
jgi:hypothetical protein